MKVVRLLAKILLVLVLSVAVLLAVSLAPADQTPYPQTDAYRQTVQRLDSLKKAVKAQPFPLNPLYRPVGRK